VPHSCSFDVMRNGVLVCSRKAINLIPGTNVSLTVTSNANADRADVTITSTGGGPGGSTPTGTGFVHITDGAQDAEAVALAISDVTGLQGEIDGKADTAHMHAEADVTGLTAALAGKAASSHAHAIADVTSLQTTLDGKAASDHTHAGVYEPANANIQAHVTTAHAPSNAQKNSDITKAEIEAKLTGVISSHSHAGGADAWTVLRIAADFSTTSATAVDITGLGFTPAANTTYEFEARVMLRTAGANTVSPRLGLAWPTGMSDGVASLYQSQSATAELQAHGNVNAAVLIAAGSITNNTQSWPAHALGVVTAGASPSGSVRLQIASETAGTTVTVKAGSFLRYRSIP
jgi:hypothetical protein